MLDCRIIRNGQEQKMTEEFQGHNTFCQQVNAPDKFSLVESKYISGEHG